jgi:hypothetical protein
MINNIKKNKKKKTKKKHLKQRIGHQNLTI